MKLMQRAAPIVGQNKHHAIETSILSLLCQVFYAMHIQFAVCAQLEMGTLGHQKAGTVPRNEGHLVTLVYNSQ